MSTLRFYLFRTFLPWFIGACLFFAMLIELADLFYNLTRYIQLQVGFASILKIQLLYLPKALSFSLPIGMIFAVSFTLGNMYSNNELIAVFSSGISLVQFTLVLLVTASVVSIGSFFFNDLVVIDSLRTKNELSKSSLGFTDPNNAPNVVLIDKGGHVVYKVSLFSDATKSLLDVLLVQRDDSGRVTTLLKAQSATWDGKQALWIFKDVSRFVIPEPPPAAEKVISNTPTTTVTTIEPFAKVEDMDTYSDPLFNLAPDTFKRISQNIDELKIADAGGWIKELKDSGLPYKAAQVSYYERFSFACTPLIVAFVSCAIGSRFRKNILLLSLLVSLMLAVAYYVLQMIAGLLSTFQILPPAIGAWVGVTVFIVVGTMLFRHARS